MKLCFCREYLWSGKMFAYSNIIIVIIIIILLMVSSFFPVLYIKGITVAFVH